MDLDNHNNWKQRTHLSIEVAGWVLQRITPTGRLQQYWSALEETRVRHSQKRRRRHATPRGYTRYFSAQRKRELGNQKYERGKSDALFPWPELPSAKHIRLLKLQPGRECDPLIGELLVFHVDAGPPYEAVSHVWGDQNPSIGFLCNHKELFVTDAIQDVLRHLRLEDEARNIWIDRVCIDQSCGEECKAHVKIMHQIYRTASKVIIWLGVGNLAARDAFDVVNEASLAISLASTADRPTPEFSKVLKFGFPQPDDARWTAFCILVLRPWFTRTWILQEVALAQVAELHWGSETCPWRLMEEVLLTALNGGYEKHLYHLGESAHWANRIVNIAGWQNRNIQVPLIVLLSATPGGGVTDPRDKVFALLGLANDGEEFHDMVNYQKPVEDIYSEVAAKYLQVRHRWSMLPLHLASDSAWNNERRLPSWVPDFTKASIAISLTSLGYGEPCLCQCPVPRVQPTCGIFQIRGIIHTTIAATGLHLPSRASLMPDVIVSVRLEQWRRLARKWTHDTSAESRDEAFARAIAAMPTEAPVKSFETFSEMYESYVEQLRSHPNPTPGQKNDLYGATFPYHHRVRQVCTERTFFVTADRGMGMGPWFARRDDVIVALHGAYTPFVLRKAKGGAYKLVGEAYVHGMMDRPDCCDQRWQELTLV